MSVSRSIRIGIDVGGTFTDVVAIDAGTRQVVGYTKVPTTHEAEEGVARGILDALSGILERHAIRPGEITFLAHSTTQATNALLEGDVSRIGVIGAGKGFTGWQTSMGIRFGALKLAEGRFLDSVPAYIETAGEESFEKGLATALKRMKDERVGAIVAVEAFSVDDPETESRIAGAAREAGFPATATHEVSSLYGLRLRIRTAVINAAILPKMMETSERTATGVADSGVDATLMIMRSDGGVMSLDEMRRRPILSFLSGPAAGIAGALMYEKVSDGIFLEVGGTSTDISVIRDGLPQTRPATIGGNRVFLNTLDVRTIGLAGGSMLRVRERRLAGVGPRSAHIAGCRYLAFSRAQEIESAALEEAATAGDATNRYLVFVTPDGARIAPTLTCAANFLGYVEADQYARGDAEVTRAGFVRLGEYLGMPPEEVAGEMFEQALPLVEAPLHRLIHEYHLDAGMVELVGGGGGAAAILPALRERLGWNTRISRHAPIISAVGVALALVKEVVERNVVNPSDEDVLRVRHEARTAAIRAGATPETVEVRVEVDRQRNILQATATGASEIREAREDKGSEMTEEALREVAVLSLGMAAERVQLAGRADGFRVFRGVEPVRRLGGLWRGKREGIRVVDTEGVIRLRRTRGRVLESTAGVIGGELSGAVADETAYGDAGQVVPDVFLLHGGRIANFTGITQVEHVSKLAMDELQGASDEDSVVVLICRKEYDA